jgi:hypothetical protein
VPAKGNRHRVAIERKNLCIASLRFPGYRSTQARRIAA